MAGESADFLVGKAASARGGVIGCIAAMAVSQKTLGAIGVLIFAVPFLFTLWGGLLAVEQFVLSDGAEAGAC